MEWFLPLTFLPHIPINTFLHPQKHACLIMDPVYEGL